MLIIGPDKPRVLKRCLTNAGVNIRPIATSHLMPFMGPSNDFTWLAKPALEKSMSQLSLVMQQGTGS